MASLPSNTYVFNYNAKDYDGDKTIAKTTGQLYNSDLVFSASPDSYTKDHVTFSTTDAEMLWSYAGMARSSSSPTLTIVCKVKPASTSADANIFSNRSNGTTYNYMFRSYLNDGTPCFHLHTSTSKAVALDVTSETNIVALTVNSSRLATLKSYTDNLSASATITYGSASNSGAFLNGTYDHSYDEYWHGDFYWFYLSNECLTDAQIRAVINYNEYTPAVHYVGTEAVSNFYLGASAIPAAFIGKAQIWPDMQTIDYGYEVHFGAGESLTTNLYPQMNYTYDMRMRNFNDEGSVLFGTSDFLWRFFVVKSSNTWYFDWDGDSSAYRIYRSISTDYTTYQDYKVGNFYFQVGSTTVTGTTQTVAPASSTPIMLNCPTGSHVKDMEYFKVYDEDGSLVNWFTGAIKDGTQEGVYDQITRTFYPFEVSGSYIFNSSTRFHYTSTDGNVVTPYTLSATDADGNALSYTNTYANGVGTINFSGQVESMDLSFYTCDTLESFYGLNNEVYLTSGNKMFCRCSGLSSLDLTNFDTSKVTDMSWMFMGCSQLTSLDVSGFDTSSVTDMSYMFHGCEELVSLDVSNFNTANVTNMEHMFYWLYLVSLDLTNFDTSKVTDMNRMFCLDSYLTTLTIGSNCIRASIYTNMFDYIPETGTLYYPSGMTNYTDWLPDGWTAVAK